MIPCSWTTLGLYWTPWQFLGRGNCYHFFLLLFLHVSDSYAGSCACCSISCKSVAPVPCSLLFLSFCVMWGFVFSLSQCISYLGDFVCCCSAALVACWPAVVLLCRRPVAVSCLSAAMLCCSAVVLLCCHAVVLPRYSEGVAWQRSSVTAFKCADWKRMWKTS